MGNILGRVPHNAGAAVLAALRSGVHDSIPTGAEAGMHDELPRGVLAQLRSRSRLRLSHEGLQTGAGPVVREQPGGRALREVRAGSEDGVRERSQATLREGSQPELHTGSQAELPPGVKASVFDSLHAEVHTGAGSK